MMMKLVLLFVVVVRAVILDHKQYIALQQLYNDLQCAQTDKCPVFAESEHCPVTNDNSLVCEETGVVRISIDSLELSGQLSSAIGDLTALQIVDLSLNHLTGTVPSHIGKLSNLENLYLSDNRFSGSLPSEIYSLTKLSALWTSTNSFWGTISTNIGLLSRLTSLDMRECEFSGTFPSQFGKLTSLTRLYLQKNILDGTIPQTIRQMSRLQYLYLFDNLLSGSIPQLPPSLVVTNCVLQQRGDTNCIQCSQSVCSCFDKSCTQRPATTPISTSTTRLSSSSTTTGTTNGITTSVTSPTPSTVNNDTPQPPVVSESSSIDIDSGASGDSGAVSFFPDSSSDTLADGAKTDELPVALIAGVAGGVVGLALIAGVVGLIVFRMRSKSRQSEQSNPSQSIALEPSGHQSYSEPDDVRRPKATLDSLDGRYADFSSGSVSQARY